jgi:hypothetical protein
MECTTIISIFQHCIFDVCQLYVWRVLERDGREQCEHVYHLCRRVVRDSRDQRVHEV